MVMLASAGGCQDRHPKAVELPPPVVEVSLPVESYVVDHQVFTARTQAEQSVDIKARVTGYLTRIGFKDGEMVKKDQVLFEIDNRPYAATLDQAKATLKVNQAALKKAEADLRIGLAVQKKDPGAISEQEIIRREASRDESSASVEQATAALASAQLNFDWCTVKAPIAGRAYRHLLDIGNLVMQNETVLTNIVSLQPLWAYFNVDQGTGSQYGLKVEKGEVKSPREFAVPVRMSLGDAKDFPIEGVIDFVSNQLDPNTGSIQLRATFPNEDGRLLAGMFGRVQVPISSRHSALLVNDQAIGTNQSQKYILVVDDKDEVDYRPVNVGQLHDGLREVDRKRTTKLLNADGSEVATEIEVLKPTDRVIVNGLQRVRPGEKVVPRPVNMQTMLAEPGKDKPASSSESK
jgi:RND family efflux transporter MFP subunit